MIFNIPKIVKTLALKEYAAEFGDAVLHVWVNPPRSMLLNIGENSAEDVIRLMSDLWSQGPDETKVSVEDVHNLVESTIETDPELVRWMRDRSFEMIGEHRRAQKKV